MALIQTFPQQCPSAFSQFLSSSYNPPIAAPVSVRFTVLRCSLASPVTVVNGRPDEIASDRNKIRLGLPSKGRMATDTLDLLKDCQLSVKQVNPRQYVAEIPQIANLEVWFQRPKDVVRKLVSGDLDIGIVGLDTVSEFGQGNEDLIIVHEALGYGDCHLSLAIPQYGIFENINSMRELAEMPQWTADRPFRVATGFAYLGPKFMEENGLKHVMFSTADGALEAASADGALVVDKNGSGDSLTVQGAIDMVPDSNSDRVKIYILPGIYREKVTVPASKPYISLIRNQNKTNQTVITWSDKASDKAMDGSELGTYRTTSVTILSNYFCATAITFQNSIVAVSGSNGMQAVASRIAGDKAMLYGVRILGTQDTLLDDTGSHYFYKCYIQGTVDFVFGRARSLYKDCTLHSTAERFGAIAAHHWDSPFKDTGFSFINCKINGSGTVYLGRAWGNYSRAIYSYCDIGHIITPSGWSDWNSPSRDKTAVFGEFQCSGKGADRRYQVPWSKSLSLNEARPFLDMKFINGEQWLRL